MTQEEFTQKILSEFSTTELCNINPRIYFNPKHIDYYMAYHSGEYQKCYDFLIEHKDLLQ